MSSIEGKYQLKPQGRAKLWWSIVGFATVLLLLPVVINAAVPTKAIDYRNLTLDGFGVPWEVPIVTEGAAPVNCEMVSDELTMKYWDCNGDTTVVTMVVEDVEDPSNTLRRMVNASLIANVSEDLDAVASEDGTAHALYVPSEDQDGMVALPIIALSQQGSGDYENLTAIAVVNGESDEYYADHIWSSMAKDRGLPYAQELPIEIEADPWTELSPPNGLNELEELFPQEDGVPFELPFDLQEELDRLYQENPDLYTPNTFGGK